jgi:uncharacterized membrane protein HdeD (DUF308 family)
MEKAPAVGAYTSAEREPGDFGHKAFLLVVWVGASALAHGTVQIVTAFRLRPVVRATDERS